MQICGVFFRFDAADISREFLLGESAISDHLSLSDSGANALSYCLHLLFCSAHWDSASERSDLFVGGIGTTRARNALALWPDFVASMF